MWVKFIPSHVPFIILNLTVETGLKSVDFDEVTGKNKLAPFYGPRCICQAMKQDKIVQYGDKMTVIQCECKITSRTYKRHIPIY